MKKILIITLIVFVSVVVLAVGAFGVWYLIGSLKSTAKSAQKATVGQSDPADIIDEATGLLKTLPGDWHRWRGANQDGIVQDAGLNLNWAAKKPALKWVFRNAGAGFSGPTVVGTTLYLSGAAEGEDFAFALDTRTGKVKWMQSLGEQFLNSYGDGPRGTITVDEGRLYLVRGGGKIHCLSAVDGKMVWQKDLNGSLMGSWGYSESPLVEGDIVICTPGGKGGTMVALNKLTGATVWRTGEWTDDAAYSSPVFAVVDGVKQFIQQSNKGVAGVRADDGKLLWRIIVPGYSTAVVPTPVYHDNMVYVTAGYSAGCAGIRLSKKGETFHAEMVYNNKTMVNHHGGVVLVGGHIYGFSDSPGWTCQNFRTGEAVWNTGRTRGAIGKGAILAANDRLILLEERSGAMVVIAASPDGWKEYGRMELPERTKLESMNNMVWAHPVIANGTLYIRDQDLLFAFNLN